MMIAMTAIVGMMTTVRITDVQISTPYASYP